MIFDKNFLKPSTESTYHIYQEESGSADFVNPYNDNPYMISSLQKLKKNLRCKKKKSIIESCLDDYRIDAVENPEIKPFQDLDQIQTTVSFADYARSSYQKVLKDLENIQKLIDKLDINDPDSIRIIQ